MNIIGNNSLLRGVSEQRKKVFLEKIFPELQRDYAALYESLSAQQWDSAQVLVHKLKGIVALLDIPDLLEDLGAMSEYCKSGELHPDLLTAFKSRYSAGLTACSTSLSVANVS